MPGSIFSFYTDKHAAYSALLSKLRKRQRMIVFLRLAVFFLTIALPLLFIKESPAFAALLFVLLFGLFLILVRRFISSGQRGRYLGCLIDINQREILAQKGDPGSLFDGKEFADPDHHYSHDLDIFGYGSLFGHINRCVTGTGRESLAGMLLNPAGNIEEVAERQRAFEELGGKPDFCQHFIATGMMYRGEDGDRQQLLDYINSAPRFAGRRGLAVMSKLLPVITLVSIAAVIAGMVPFSVFVVLFLFQLFLTGFMIKPVNEIHVLVSRRLDTLNKYGKLLEIIEKPLHHAPLLDSLRRQIMTGDKPPSAAILGLSRLVDAFDNRLNLIAAVLLNGILLWDINCVLLLDRWNLQYRAMLPLWLESIACMDAYISFAVFRFNNPDYIFPEVTAEGPPVKAVSVGHPLIPADERVCNDISIEENGRFVIVTGANMAGKSTFLRTTGIALVLAMAGAPVCARKFSCRLTEVWSSMRTSDSLSRNESYFYAELKRLKNLVDRLAGGVQVFVLLDEILKGTNNTDKQRGSTALLIRLTGMGAAGMVATHDLALAGLVKEFPGRFENKCFEVEIDGDRVHFDFILRDGPTNKMNAMILMKKMGLLPC